MSVSTRPGRATAIPVAQHPADDSLAGLGTMVRLVVRRNRVRVLVWFAVIVGLFAYVEAYYASIFTTQAALDDFAKVSNVPSIKALTGLAAAPNTMGGAVWTKIWMTCTLMLAFGVVFLLTRSGRADEEAGRTELLRSRMLGAHAYSAASWIVTSVLCVAVGLGVTAVSIAGRLDPVDAGVTGSLVLGASMTGVGLVAVGLGALAGQLTSTSRAANALASTVLGAFYLLRMVGDLGDGRLTWVSPVGWGQQMQPWGANRWWPFALLLALTALLLLAAAHVEARRDLGAGLLSERSGPADAPARNASPLGLGLRLQRGPIIGWTLTLVLAALMCGSVVDAMNKMMSDSGANLPAIIRGTGVDALVSMLLTVLAMITAVFAIQTSLSLRGDEANGIIEPQLAGAVSRTQWALQRLAIPAVGSAVLLLLSGALLGLGRASTTGQYEQIGSLALAELTYWPAVMVFVGVAVLLFGWLPRLAVALTWGVLTAMWVVVLVGDPLHLPNWLLDAVPFSATPYQPLEQMSWPPVLLLAAVAAALVWLGLARLARRDIQNG